MKINSKIVLGLAVILISIQIFNFSITAFITATGEIDVDVNSTIEVEERIGIRFQGNGTCIDYNYTTSALRVFQVQICARKNITDATLKLRKITCSSLPTPPNIVYICLQFVKTDIPTTSIENITVRFNVENSWIDSNEIDTSKILMYKYISSWNSLTTYQTNVSAENTSYKSLTDDFSYFAVTGKTAAAPEEAPEAGGGGIVSTPTPSPAPALPKEEPEEIEEEPHELPEKPLFDISVKMVSAVKRISVPVLLSLLSSLILLLSALLIFFYKIVKLDKLE